MTSSKDVVVTAGPPGNAAPTAAFTYLCSSLDCSFTDGSSDTDGSIDIYAWEFGDGAGSDQQSPNHTYVATQTSPFTVKLTVTDDDGATASVTQVVTVTPPAAGQCDNGSGTLVSCGLDVTERSHITVTLLSNNCTARGNALTFTVPSQGFSQKIFSSGCTLVAPAILRC